MFGSLYVVVIFTKLPRLTTNIEQVLTLLTTKFLISELKGILKIILGYYARVKLKLKEGKYSNKFKHVIF